jgi:hypothetical protein
MAAGLGFKDFVTGEVLTAADVDGYLMQGIWVFANATARDAAVTSPQEGNFAFLKDTNTTTYYTGSAWANLDTTGMVNPMTTTGDTIYSSSGSTPARLGIGTAGQVLQVNSGATAPEWATPASGGGLTLINTGGTTLSGASVTLSSIPGTYKALKLVVVSPLMATDGTGFFVRVNADSNTRYANWMSGEAQNVTFADTQWVLLRSPDNTVSTSLGVMDFFDYANTTSWKMAYGYSIVPNMTTTTNLNHIFAGFGYNQTSAITSLVLSPGSGNFTSGTAYLYGVN